MATKKSALKPAPKRKIAKSAVTGKIVSNAEAKANPDTTFHQTVKRKPKGPAETRTCRDEYPFAFRNGQAARRASIPKSQAPVFSCDDERKAWLEGYGD